MSGFIKWEQFSTSNHSDSTSSPGHPHLGQLSPGLRLRIVSLYRVETGPSIAPATGDHEASPRDHSCLVSALLH